jgi:hypothetical protein
MFILRMNILYNVSMYTYYRMLSDHSVDPTEYKLTRLLQNKYEKLKLQIK